MGQTDTKKGAVDILYTGRENKNDDGDIVLRTCKSNYIQQTLTRNNQTPRTSTDNNNNNLIT